MQNRRTVRKLLSLLLVLTVLGTALVPAASAQTAPEQNSAKAEQAVSVVGSKEETAADPYYSVNSKNLFLDIGV